MLKEAGYNIFGIHMQNWDEEEEKGMHSEVECALAGLRALNACACSCGGLRLCLRAPIGCGGRCVRLCLLALVAVRETGLRALQFGAGLDRCSPHLRCSRHGAEAGPLLFRARYARAPQHTHTHTHSLSLSLSLTHTHTHAHTHTNHALTGVSPVGAHVQTRRCCHTR